MQSVAGVRPAAHRHVSHRRSQSLGTIFAMRVHLRTQVACRPGIARGRRRGARVDRSRGRWPSRSPDETLARSVAVALAGRNAREVALATAPPCQSEARRATHPGCRVGACIAGVDAHDALEWRQSDGRRHPSDQCDESPHRLLGHGPAAANGQARVSSAQSAPSAANAQTRVREWTPAGNSSTRLALCCRVQTTACTAVRGATTPPSSCQDAARD